MKYRISYTVTEEYNTEKEAATAYNELSNKYKDLKTEFIPTPKDELIEFLDNNPAEETKQPKKLNKFQQELIWLADLEAEQIYNDQHNSFHL
jgi:hypothetical protein